MGKKQSSLVSLCLQLQLPKLTLLLVGEQKNHSFHMASKPFDKYLTRNEFIRSQK